MNNNCPICQNKSTHKTFSFSSHDKNINVYECNQCDFEYLDIWDDIDFVKSLYSGNNYIFTHNISNDKKVTLKFDEYKNNYLRIKPFLKKHSHLLEIGCGDGKFLDMVKNDVASVECIELSPPQVLKLRKKGYKCYDLMIEDLKIEKKYDVICLFAVLEHVANVENFLTVLKKFLKPDGNIFIEVPNRKNILFSGFKVESFRKFYYRDIHLYYFTPNSLKKLLSNNGYKCNLETSQQASITNHFHWLHNKKGQENANIMTSIYIPDIDLEKQFSDVLEQTDNFYRKTLNENGLGDLLFARASL